MCVRKEGRTTEGTTPFREMQEEAVTRQAEKEGGERENILGHGRHQLDARSYAFAAARYAEEERGKERKPQMPLQAARSLVRSLQVIKITDGGEKLN